MTQLQVVASVTEEQRLTADGAAVCVFEECVCAGSEDGGLKVYNHHTLQLTQEFEAHQYCITDLLTLGTSLFTASVDCTVKIWHTTTSTFINKASCTPHEDAIRRLATNGVYVFAGDDKGDVRLYDVDGRCKATHNLVEEIWGLQAQGDLIYTVRDRGVTISELQAESNKSSVINSVEGRAPLLVHGDWLVCADQSGMNLVVRENKRPSYNTLGELKGHEMIINALASCGPGRVVSGGWDNKVIVWDLSSLTQLASASLPGCVAGLAASEDGCIFATGSGGYVCKLKIT